MTRLDARVGFWLVCLGAALTLLGWAWGTVISVVAAWRLARLGAAGD